MKINKLQRCFLVVIMIFINFIISINIVKADNGPKPQLKIIVVNPPEDEYYLDLLVDYEVNNGYTWLHEEEYNKEKIDIFKNFREENWRPALLTKTRAPMNAKLIGRREEDKVIHDFGYTLPDRFKIAILDSKNKINVSDEITLKGFNTTLIYNYENKAISYKNEIDGNRLIIGTINEMLSSKGIVFTFLITIIIEGITLILFKFSIKKSIKPLILINIFTQILLYVALILLVNKYSYKYYITTLLSMEGIILVVESILFSRYLQEHTVKWRIAFSIVANILSFLSGYIIYLFI